MGRPVERVLRQTVIAMRLADAAGVDPGIRAATYYTSLLTWVGCATDTSELTVLFGEEEGLYADTHDGDLTPMAMGVFVARHLGRGGPALRRVGMVGRFLATADRSVQKVMEAHCLAAGEFADRLGLGEEVRSGLLQAFERWDGKGVPGRVGSVEVSPAIRMVHLADNVEAYHQAGGLEAAVGVARERRGTQFDPDLAARDFDAAVSALDPHVGFRALLPRRMLDLSGRDAVRSTLDTWFGGAERWELVEAVVGEVGERIHLHWRVRLTNPVVGPGVFLVEQQVYAIAGADGTLRDVALLCSGYLPERS